MSLLCCWGNVEAFDFLKTTSGKPTRWFKGEIEYWINPVGSGLPVDVTIAAVNASFASWSQTGIGVTFRYMGITSAKFGADQMNVVFWDTLGEHIGAQASDDAAVQNALGWTAPIKTDESTGEILERDIVLNGTTLSSFAWAKPDLDSFCLLTVAWNLFGIPVQWNTERQGISGPFFGFTVYYADVQSVLTHEIGHFLGLAHSSTKGATMSTPDTSPCFFSTTDERSLESDDIAGIKFLYTPCFAPPTNLVGWWPGDDNANDIVGTNNGTLNAGATATAQGKVGQAFSFDGVDDAVLVSAAPALDVGQADGFTVEAWIFPSGSSGLDPIGRTQGSGPIVEWSNGVHLWQDAGTGPFTGLYANVSSDPFMGVNHDDHGHHPMQAFDVVTQQTWNHVALTYSKTSGVGTLYVNGSAVHSEVLGSYTPKTATDLNIGRRPSGSFGPYAWSFNGLIDEVSLYNRALSAQEILAIFNAGSAGKCKPN